MARIMKTEEFIRALIAALPGRKIEGKKRLQKLAYFIQEAGADGGAKFYLKNFGPYSAEVDNSTVLLTILGGLEETSKVVGKSDYLTTVYSLPDDDLDIPELPDQLKSKLASLDRFTTIELEIASTVRLFEQQGNQFEKAVQLTKEMKPTKASEKVLQKVPEILRVI